VFTLYPYLKAFVVKMILYKVFVQF
jgi:hypothetical protein